MYETRNWQPTPIEAEAEAAVYGENGYVVVGKGR